MSRRPRYLSLLLAGLWAVPCGAALAQADEFDSLAREQFQRGVEAAARRDYETAVVRFQTAQALRSAPSIRFNLASALYELKRYPEAFQALSGLDTSELPASLRARIDALALSLRAQIAVLSVHSLRDGYRLRLDGTELPELARGEPVAVAPGTHELQVLEGERTVLARVLELAAGVRFELDVAESATPEAAPVPVVQPVSSEPARAPDPAPDRAATRGSSRKLYVELGVAALVIVGVAVAVPLAMARQRGGGDEPPPTAGFAPGVLSW
jgi:hypothetical protein